MTNDNTLPDDAISGAENPEVVQSAIVEDLINSGTDIDAVVEMTVKEMLNADDASLTPEQRHLKAEWRDSMIVVVIAEGLHASWSAMLKGMGNGKTKNNRYNQGYMAALLDLHKKLSAIVPPEFQKYINNTPFEESANDAAAPATDSSEQTDSTSPEHGSAGESLA